MFNTAARLRKTFQKLPCPVKHFLLTLNWWTLEKPVIISFLYKQKALSFSIFLISRFHHGYRWHQILFFLLIMCTIKIHLAEFRELARWPGFNLQIKKCLCFSFIFPIYWLIFLFFSQESKLALGNKATRVKCYDRNPNAVQPIQMFQEQLSASAGAEQRAQHRQVTALLRWILAGQQSCQQSFQSRGWWWYLGCILLRDGAGDRGCKYYWRTWHGPKVWLTGSNKKGMFLCVCYMGWVLQTGLQVHLRKQGLQQHIPSLVQGLSLSWVLLWSGCSVSGLVLVLVYYNVHYTQGTVSCIWGAC